MRVAEPAETRNQHKRYRECQRKIQMSVFLQFRSVSGTWFWVGGGGRARSPRRSAASDRRPMHCARNRTAAAVLRLLGRPRFLEIKPETPATRYAFNNRHTWRSLRPKSCAAAPTASPPRSISRNTSRRRKSPSLTLSTATAVAPHSPPKSRGD